MNSVEAPLTLRPSSVPCGAFVNTPSPLATARCPADPFDVVNVSCADVSANGRVTIVVEPPPSRFIPFQTPIPVMKPCNSFRVRPVLLLFFSAVMI
ncbi:hypothetical protein D3C81_1241830 [compost metagenome]